PDQLVDRLDHVHGDPDRAGLVGDGSRDGLADPPRGVRAELVALGVVELLDRADEPEISFLDEVQEQHPATHVPLGDRHDEPEVRLDQLLLGELPVALDSLEEIDRLGPRLRPVRPPYLLPPHALVAAPLPAVALVLAAPHYRVHDPAELLLVHLAVA